jgi:hypothetical protein
MFEQKIEVEDRQPILTKQHLIISKADKELFDNSSGAELGNKKIN